MRRNLYVFLISLCVWIYLFPFAYSAAADDTMIPVLGPGWDALIRSSPWAVIVALVCKWFMAHIDAKDKLYVDLASRKDEQLMSVIAHCREDHNQILQQLTDLFTRGRP